MQAPHTHARTYAQQGGRLLPDVEVLYINILVGGRFPLAPQQQALFGRHLCKNQWGLDFMNSNIQDADDPKAHGMRQQPSSAARHLCFL